MKNIVLFSLFTSILSLLTALIAQYGFNLAPCELCTMQRMPYVLVLILSVAGLMNTWGLKYRIYVIAATFIVGAGIATYHAAVEKHMIEGPTACTSAESPPGQSIEELMKKIKEAPIVACNQPQWEFHGVTMAVLNAVWSLLLGIIVIVAIRKVQYAQTSR